MSNVKAHTRYKLRNGKVCPSVTTILNSQLGWNKAALVAWSAREALQGNDPDALAMDAADSGTVTHKLVEGHIKVEDVDVSDFTANQIAAGKVGFAAFQSWEHGREIEYVHTEHQVISELYKFGGTIDILCRIDGVLSLIDLKTSKSLYPEFVVQVAAYGRAYEEQESQKIGKYHLLRLSKSGGGYEHHVISPERVEVAWSVFKHCRELYDLQKELK